MRKVKSRKNKKWIKYIVTFAIFILAVTTIVLGRKFILKIDISKHLEEFIQAKDGAKEAILIKEKPVQIYKGDSRNVAVMVSNERAAWPQAGLNNAFLVYEAIIEGGETRFMALFKQENLPDKIGPVRSSRHYYLDYLPEYDPIYAHFGWSDLAMQRIKQRGVQNVNGIYDNYFWREGRGYNNAFVSKKTITNFASQKGYSLKTNKEFPYKISGKPVEIENGTPCVYAKLIYSSKHYVEYSYNETDKLYYRSMRGEKHVDRVTKNQLAAKNIIVMKVNNFNLNDYKGSARQDLNNIGSGDGYYITNGKSTKITWNKSSYTQKTIFKDLTGKEITLNDGLTFVQIVPTKYDVTIN